MARLAKEIDITPSGARILKAHHEIPFLARTSLDKYANNKIKELKVVTKAYKYTFPFYEAYNSKKAFNTIFSLAYKSLLRKIPYLTLTKVPFIDQPSGNSDKTVIRIGPYNMEPTSLLHRKVTRYLRMLNNIMRRYQIPIVYTTSPEVYVVPNKADRNGYWPSEEEKRQNTYRILSIVIRPQQLQALKGYLLIYYYPHIEKVLMTLHRLAYHFNSEEP